ncbi:MAG: hypothetical protein GX974_04920 [Clostridiales bacterium]|nr:hypothetical protein [Clostridiales bacterium]
MNIDNKLKSISLDGEWEFCYRNSLGNENMPNVPKDNEFVAKMPVPAYWDDHIDRLKATDIWGKCRFNPDYEKIDFPMADMPPDASLPYIIGVGYYRKKIYIEDLFKDQTTILSIGGVCLEAWVWINGELVDYHLGHSTAYTVALDEYIEVGEQNEIIIAVANTRKDRSGCVLRGYKGLSAGIYGSIDLKIAGAARIEDLYIYPTDGNEKLNWNIDIYNTENLIDLSVHWAIKDLRGNILGEGREDVDGESLHMKTGTFGMKPWSDREPNLYNIELILYRDKDIVDTRIQSFGLRTLTTEGTALKLNSEPIFLRGATEHAYFPLTCTPPRNISAYREYITRLKEIGFNWLRFHTWVPSKEYMQAADELGMLLQVEGPVGFEEKEWIDILKACRKHPSVTIYCCGNEELLDEKKIEKLRIMAKLCKEYAPDSLFNPQEALRGIEYVWNKKDIGDDLVSEPFLYNRSRLESIKEFSDVLGQYTWGLLSYESTKGDFREIDRRLSIYERPCLSHENGIHGNYLNLDLEKRYEGTRIGTRLFSKAREYLQKEGVIHKAPLYYKNSCQWMRIIRKHNLETARKCRLISGYDFLGAIDHHWHRCGYPGGIMNEFFELKPGESVDDVLKYNGENVLLLDNKNRVNFYFGDKVDFPIEISFYGREPIDEATLYWYLKDENGYVHERGGLKVNDILAGRISHLGNIRFSMPYLDKASHLILSVRLSGGIYEILNSWDIWAFPKCQFEGKLEGIQIVDAIDSEALDLLQNGGKVVLMGTKPFESLPIGFQPSVTGRTIGNVATVIYDHPIMRGFPHNGYCDWQFYNMLEDSRAVVFNDLDIEFDPIIEIVSSFKRIKRQSSLFELRVGKGRLLVCGLNVDNRDPASICMLNLIGEYMKSDNFQPKIELGLDELKILLGSQRASLDNLSTDQAFDVNAQL